MIKFSNVSFAYQSQSSVIIRDFSAAIPNSEFSLVVGKTGSGKSTLLNLINGNSPYLTGGLLAGDVEVFGINTKQHSPRDFAEIIGVVVQDPRNSFVTSMVEDELAYSMECLGVAPQIMRQRIDETAELLGLTHLLSQPIETLSAGQLQRVAIAAVLVNRPKVLVLDEPTSALDPAAAEEVLASLQRLVHDLGVCIVAAEHRLERVLQFADRVIYVPGGAKPIQVGPAAEIMEISEIAPPIVQLGKQLNWNPLPLSVREARKFADPLISQLLPVTPATQLNSGSLVAKVNQISVNFGSIKALNDVSLEIESATSLAILGKNGAGKSTLLATIAGLIRPSAGSVTVANNNPAELSGKNFLSQIGFVPQEPADLLLQTSIAAECELTDKITNLKPGTTADLVQHFLPRVDLAQHPLDLSEGQRLLLVLALIMVNSPKLLLLDEPTRGLDYAAKAKLVSVISEFTSMGTAVLVATHDVELVAELNAKVIILSGGEIIASGAARDVLPESVSFAPQITRAFAPLNLLTLKEAVDAIKLAG